MVSLVNPGDTVALPSTVPAILVPRLGDLAVGEGGLNGREGARQQQLYLVTSGCNEGDGEAAVKLCRPRLVYLRMKRIEVEIYLHLHLQALVDPNRLFS